MRSILIFFILVFIPSVCQAQSLKGKVTIQVDHEEEQEDREDQIADGAKVFWLNGTQIAKVDHYGLFEIACETGKDTIVIHYKSLYKDTLIIKDKSQFITIALHKVTKKRLQEIRVGSSRPTVEVNYLSASQAMKITKKELAKAACCNLSEAFETTPSVDVSYTDAITGQKQIQMLGLSTPNTLFTHENIPTIRGLASIVGLNFTPGTFIDGIQLTKGSGSVVNGYESLAGQINVELMKPDKAEKLLVNLYQGTGGRSELNTNIAHKWNEQLASGLLLHGKSTWHNQDMNHDGFRDNPLEKTGIALLRNQLFTKKGFEIQTVHKIVKSQNIGGNIIKNASSFHFDNNIDRTENWIKIGKSFTSWKSFGLQLAYITHNQSMNTSFTQYQNQQRSLYGNYIFQSIIKTTANVIKIGASFMQDNTAEQLSSINLLSRRKEIVPGIFGEYSYSYLDDFNIVLGIRADRHNLFGTFITPRLHLRYSLNKEQTIRASIGRAQRAANIISENQNILFSSRNILLQGEATQWTQGLLPEVSWNSGVSYSHGFKMNYRPAALQLDAYYSFFIKQMIVDYETPREVRFYYQNQFTGKRPTATSLQAQLDYEILRKKLDVRLAYRFYHIVQPYSDTILSKPLVSTHRGFLNLAYKLKVKTKFDLTAVYNGPKRLSNARSILSDTWYQEAKSPSFFIFNTHISHNFNKVWEAYLGIENFTNKMQHHPIKGSTNSLTDPNFDATQVWGPIMGSNGYVGFKYKLN